MFSKTWYKVILNDLCTYLYIGMHDLVMNYVYLSWWWWIIGNFSMNLVLTDSPWYSFLMFDWLKCTMWLKKVTSIRKNIMWGHLLFCRFFKSWAWRSCLNVCLKFTNDYYQLILIFKNYTSSTLMPFVCVEDVHRFQDKERNWK